MVKIACKKSAKSSTGAIFRHMAILSSGAIIAKVITILLMPVITRIYLPEHLGVLASFTSLTLMLSPCGTLLYHKAIPLLKNNGLAVNLVVLCVSILAIYAIMITLFFGYFSPILLGVFSMDVFLPFWWFIPAAVVSAGMYDFLNYWAIREKAFAPLARTRILKSVIGISTKIGLGFLGVRPLGLLIGQLFDQMGGILSLLNDFFNKLRFFWKDVSVERILFLAKHYAEFPKYRLPSQFLLMFSTKIPVLFFAWQYGAELTGQFGLAIMVLAVPMDFFGQAIGQAYYAEISGIGRRYPKAIYEVTKTLVKKLFLVSIIPFLVLFFLGPWLFEFVFGGAWRQAGVFASILAFYLLGQLIFSPIGNVLTVIEKQKVLFVLHLCRFFGIVLILYSAYFLNLSALSVVVMYSLLMNGHYVFSYLITMKLVKFRTTRV